MTEQTTTCQAATGRTATTARPRFLCYGDSNTWGYIPGGGRLPQECLYAFHAARLVPELELVAEGLNGRSSVWESTVFPAELQGGATFAAVFRAHLPLQGLVLMLGTNDVMAPLNLPGERIADNLARMVHCARALCPGLVTVLVSPPPIAPLGVSELARDGWGETALLGQNLAEAFASCADKEAILFWDGSSALGHMDGPDGYHMTAAGHAALGKGLGAFLAKAVVPNMQLS